jgi:hypothetical protein
VLQISARSAADTGLEHAVRHMVTIWNASTDKDAFELEWAGSDADAAKFSFPADPADMVQLDNHNYGKARFRYEIYKGNRPQGYKIISTGTAGGVTRRVHAAMMLKSSLIGIGAKKDIYVAPNMDLGTVPDGETFIIQTNSIEDNTITLKPNIFVPGDVVIGPGGDTVTGIDTVKSVFITGEARAAEDYIDFPPVYPPSNLALGSPTIDLVDDSIARIPTSMILDELDFGFGEFTGVKTLYIGDNGGEVKIFVDGFTRLNSGAKIIVKEGTSLKLYLGGNMQAMPNCSIYYGDGTPVGTAEIEEAATRISIYGTVNPVTGEPYCTNIEFKPNGSFYGSIYAPEASLQLEPLNNFYGAIIGGNDVDLKPGGTYLYVASLFDFPDIEVMYMGVKHGSWWEELP